MIFPPWGINFSAMSPERDVGYLRLARIFYRREAEKIEVSQR